MESNSLTEYDRNRCRENILATEIPFSHLSKETIEIINGKTINTLVEIVDCCHDTTKDFSHRRIKEIIENNTYFSIYSNVPIENGTLVTPSRMLALEWCGQGKLYKKKKIRKGDVAWLTPLKGIYGGVTKSNHLFEVYNPEWEMVTEYK